MEEDEVDEEKARKEGRIRQEEAHAWVEGKFQISWRCFHLHMSFIQKRRCSQEEKREFEDKA
jgi:predicted 3-demethylubiquinone-9 3-methyltransferase (glyoxalase superfamily)